jgi:DNA polymerase III delta subunit
MKIIVLHGDNERASYQRLEKFIGVAKTRGWQVNFIDGPESISEKLISVSLFGQEPFFVIRDINKWPPTTFKKIKKVLEKGEGTVVIYHNDFLGKTLLESLPKTAKLEEFKLPRIIFDFLDSFYPGNAKRTLRLLHELVAKEPPEFVFAFLAKHTRDLFWVTTGSSLPYPSWRVLKLKAQASKYKKEDLKSLIKELSEIDIKVKTSEAELIPSLDLLIVRQLQ